MPNAKMLVAVAHGDGLILHAEGPAACEVDAVGRNLEDHSPDLFPLPAVPDLYVWEGTMWAESLNSPLDPHDENTRCRGAYRPADAADLKWARAAHALAEATEEPEA